VPCTSHVHEKQSRTRAHEKHVHETRARITWVHENTCTNHVARKHAARARPKTRAHAYTSSAEADASTTTCSASAWPSRRSLATPKPRGGPAALAPQARKAQTTRAARWTFSTAILATPAARRRARARNPLRIRGGREATRAGAPVARKITGWRSQTTPPGSAETIC